MEGSLFSSAVILSISALEQGTKTCLKYFAGHESLEDDSIITTTKFYKAIRESLWHRVKTLPVLLSEGRLKLNTVNKNIKVIRKCITLRNTLVHCTDFVLNSKVSELTEATVDYIEHDNVFRVVLPFNPDNFPLWNVSRTEAEQCIQAVDLYIEGIVELSYTTTDLVDMLRKSELITIAK